MRNGIRIALASTALMAGLAVAGASPTNAQVSFQGSFPLPHGQISIAIGDPAFAVGAYAPPSYPIVFRPSYGYGFGYHDHWIPVRRYGPSWIVCDRPYVVGPVYGYRVPAGHYYRQGYAYGHGHPYAYGHGYSNEHGHGSQHGHGNQHGHGH